MSAKKPHKDQLVIILHGIGMSRWRMAFLDVYLRSKGYATMNVTYPSLKQDIDTCAKFVAHKITQYKKDHHARVHLADGAG